MSEQLQLWPEMERAERQRTIVNYQLRYRRQKRSQILHSANDIEAAAYWIQPMGMEAAARWLLAAAQEMREQMKMDGAG